MKCTKKCLAKDKVGYHAAEVPVLSGCVTHGRISEEVKEKTKETIVGWLEIVNDYAVP